MQASPGVVRGLTAVVQRANILRAANRAANA